MSQPNQPSQSGPFGPPPQPQAPSGAASGWGQPNQAWGQPNQAWGGQQTANGSVPAAPRHVPGRPADQFDAQQPLGGPRQPSVSIQQFKPKGNRMLPWLLVLLVAGLVAGLLYYGLRPDPIGQGSVEPSQSADASPASPRRTVTPPAPGEYATETLFESDRVAGLFKLNQSHWEGDTLVADVTIEVDRGSLNYAFFTMHMDTGDVYEPDRPTQSSDLPGGTIEAGDSVSGTVRITKPRGDTQLILSDLAGRNLTMLAIKG